MAFSPVPADSAPAPVKCRFQAGFTPISPDFTAPRRGAAHGATEPRGREVLRSDCPAAAPAPRWGAVTAEAPRRATYEDVLRAPPGHVAQVIFGVLHTHPRPAFAHASATSSLGILLGARFRFGDDGPGGWIILDEPELHLGPEPDIVVPDLAGWRRDRGQLPERSAAWSAVAPDWICEVLSPSTQAIDRADKMEVYHREEIRHVWLVDPNARTLEVYRHGGEAWIRVAVHAGDVLVRVEPFEAMELPLGRLWEL
ncbi:MAG: Uma2 family endonuclease [Myxococcales bacterium]|nr:Uma2 family endonuclease [Myxococcales bacterium]